MDIQDEIDELLLALEELKLALLLYNASITLVIEQGRLDIDRELHDICGTDNILRKAYNPAEPRDEKGRWTKGSLLVTIPPNIGDLVTAGKLGEKEKALIDNIPYCGPDELKEMAIDIAQSKNATILGEGWVKATLYKIQTALAARLAKVTCHYSKRLPHILQGLPMSFMVADSGRGNSSYNMTNARKLGYMSNCATCIVAFEGRLRGYDVEACPNTPGSVVGQLALDPNRVWVDPTGHHPTPIEYTQGTTIGLVYWLKANVVPGQRYTLRYKRKGETAHIVSVLYNEDSLTIYDGQSGDVIVGNGIKDYINDLELDYTKYPRLTRIDDCYFNLDMIESVVRKRG